MNTISEKQKKQAIAALRKATAKLKAIEYSQTEPIAIIGMACRFPGGSNNPEAFWKFLREGGDAITEIPKERWDVDAFYDSALDTPGKMYIREVGALREPIDQFEPEFFGISPREANYMDPQHRMLLEVTWEALERAGQAPDKLKGSQTGVFIGLCATDYQKFGMFSDRYEDINAYAGIGTGPSFLPGRLSQVFGLHGPSFTVDTACSTSLVTLHLACQSLRSNECNLAFSGGVQLFILPNGGIWLSKMQALSPNCRSRSFDADADGYARGEGCAMVILKRLSDALADKDRILALIRGSGVNHDGGDSGLIVPNEKAQSMLTRRVLERAGIDPSDVSYVEAHGTGTPVGDPIEAKALITALGKGRSTENPLIMGSLKSNIGHLETTAGISGLIKTVLCLQHKEIPPNLHFNKLNPRLEGLPILVPTEIIPWEVEEGKKRLGAINSFGIAGTNAHVVLEETPDIKIEEDQRSEHAMERSEHLFTISAKRQASLEELAVKYADFLESDSETSLTDICFTANTGRSHFNHRLAINAESKEQLAERLRAFYEGESATLSSSGETIGEQPKIAFLFTGQGSQYIDMSRKLYDASPVFRETLDRCAEILSAYLDRSLLEIIFSDSENHDDNHELNETGYTQPALFALEYSLFKLWESWGVKPDVVMGHSVGEYTASCAAGVFSLEDGLKLIAARGALMQELPKNGGMLSAAISAEKAEALIEPYLSQVSIAAFNEPGAVVISGHKEALETIEAVLTKEEVKTKPLMVSHAFHSPLMEPMLEKLERTLGEITFSSPELKIISNLTGKVAGDEITKPDYWLRHTRRAVRFVEGIKTMDEQGCDVFVELGPKPILMGMGRSCLPKNKDLWLPSLRSAGTDWRQMLQSLGKLYVRGLDVDWSGFDADYSRSKVILPTYVWQRKRYWVDKKAGYADQPFMGEAIHPLLGRETFSAVHQEGALFESYIGLDSLPYLSDHRIFENAVLPGAGFLEMALAAGAVYFKSDQLDLAEVMIQQALIIDEENFKKVQLVLNPSEAQDRCQFKIFSLDEEEGEDPVWNLHISGKIILRETTEPAAEMNLDELWSRCSDEGSVEEFYKKFGECELNYGPAFQGVEQIWRGNGEALGQLHLPDEAATDLEKYYLHPSLLDAVLQVSGSIMPSEGDKTYLPIGVDRLKFYQPPESVMWCHASVGKDIKPDQEILKFKELKLFTPEGKLAAELEGFIVKKASLAAILRQSEQWKNWLYQIDWIQRDKKKQKESTAPEHCLIFADRQGVSRELTGRLKNQDVACALVFKGEEYKEISEREFEVNPENADDFQRLLERLKENFFPAKKAKTDSSLLYLWGLDSPKSEELPDDIGPELKTGVISLMLLTQALLKAKLPKLPAFLMATQNAQFVPARSSDMEIAQTPLWGMAKVIVMEHPELRGAIIDLDSGKLENIASGLLAEMNAPEKESHIAYRQGKRYVAKLAKYKDIASKDNGLLEIPDEAFQLKTSKYGLLENLYLKPTPRRDIQDHEIEIRVMASGLNFRDVLNALGMLKEYYAEYMGITEEDQLTFGFECAGKVTAVGQNVADFKIGDKVMTTITHESLGSFVVVPAAFAVLKPERLSFEEAATIPLVFLTAYYGLERLAKIQPGDKVLIQAAAGGVGLAATQLVQLRGAEVFATASEPKWDYLRSIGVKHIMNSRSLDFADEIMRLTDGKGVDVVLNSLNGDYIDKSFEVLGQGGRFVEIGKLDIWTEEEVKERRPDASYFPFDMGVTAAEDPGLITDMFSELAILFNQEKLQALNHKVFSIKDIVSSFRYMQQTKHIGKVIISMKDALKEEFSVKEDGAYLITGGLGGLGLRVAQWMAEQGAGTLVLTSRSGISDRISDDSLRQMDVVREMEELGTKILTPKADVADRKAMAEAIEAIKESPHPLKGVIHAAGVIDDAMLMQISPDQFAKVMPPKVEGAWNLHTLTLDENLDFFVCFSSVASLMGSAGQANYASANAFMDGLAYYRKGLGLPGLSVNWGPWADVGMAASMDKVDQDRLSKVMKLIPPDQGLHIMEQSIFLDPVQVGVMSVNWPLFLQQFGAGKAPSVFAELAKRQKQASGKKRQAKQSKIIKDLEAAPKAERLKILTGYLQSEVAKILGRGEDQLPNVDKDFSELGMDSLMAVELKNVLEVGLKTEFSASLLFDTPTIGGLSKLLVEERFNFDDPEEGDAKDEADDKNRIALDRKRQFRNFLKAAKEVDRSKRGEAKNAGLQSVLKRSSINAEIFQQAYAANSKVAFIGNVMCPEFLFPMDIIPFNVEMLAALLSTTNTAIRFLDVSEQNNISRDICSMVRCVEGAALEDCLPTPDFIAHASYPCDSSSKLMYNFGRKYQTEEFLLDIPYDDSEDSVLYLADQIKNMVAVMEKHFGTKLDRDRLEESIKLSKEVVEYHRRVMELYRDNFAHIPMLKSIEHLISYISLMGCKELTEIAEMTYKETLKTMSQSKPKTRPRVVWHGFISFYSDEIIRYMEEECDIDLIFESNLQYTDLHKLMAVEDPYLFSAQKIINFSRLTPMEYIIQDDNMALLEQYSVDGVISFNQWGCRHFLCINQIMRDALAKNNLPLLEIDGDYIDDRNYSFSQIKVRIDAFAELLHARRF